MTRLLIDDITLTRVDRTITGQVRLKGGRNATVKVAVGLTAPEARRTPADLVAQVDRLLDHHTEGEVADQLNQAGVISGTGQAFHAGIVHHIRITYKLRSRRDRLRDQGLISLNELARHLGVCTTTIKNWRDEGLLEAEIFNDKGECLYQIPAVAPHKQQGRPRKTPQPQQTLIGNNHGGAV
jgi:hypothetical protein